MWVSHPPGWPYWKVPPGYLTLFFNTSRHILRFILSTLIFYVQICQRLKNSEKHGTASKFYFFNILGLPCRRMRPRNNFKIFLLLIYVCSHRIIKKIPSFDIKDEQLINIIIGFLFTHFFNQFLPLCYLWLYEKQPRLFQLIQIYNTFLRSHLKHCVFRYVLPFIWFPKIIKMKIVIYLKT